jgi:heterodisulfide reductase subunit B
MKFAYYPGCSLHATGLEFDQSTRAVFHALGVQLDELDDWNCCGASSGHSLDALAAVALPARNIALAQEMNLDVLAPCAACFNRLKVAEHAIKTDPAQRNKIEDAVGFAYAGTTQIRNPIDVIVNEIGLPQVRAMVKRPLDDLRAVSYYGCLLVRPPEIVQFDDPEHPRLMDQLLAALGATPVDWAYATVCCGGSLSLTRAKIVNKLVDDIAAHAREVGAQTIVTACPLCQINLEMRQTSAAKMPIVYFTELMGLAFGLQASARWWSKHLVDPRAVVSKYATA